MQIQDLPLGRFSLLQPSQQAVSATFLALSLELSVLLGDKTLSDV